MTMLGAVIKQLAKHKVLLTVDIIPPTNTETPASTVHEIMECLAKEVGKTEFKEKLQDTKARIYFSMTDVSKFTDTVQERTQQGTIEEIVDVPVPQVMASCAEGVTLSFSLSL